MKTLRWSTLVAFVLTMSLLFAGAVYAITILVDGTREAAWDGVGGQTPGDVSDTTGDVSGYPQYDISRFQYTNDTTFMYFLLQTVADTKWEGGTSNGTVRICLDYKSGGGLTSGCSTGQGNNTDAYLGCTPESGTCQVRRWNGSTFALVSGSSTAVAYATDITEFKVDIASLMESTCYSSMNAFVYYDNGDVPNEDWALDSGSFNMTCGSPTAATLTRTGARTSWPIALGASIIFIGATLVLRRRR